MMVSFRRTFPLLFAVSLLFTMKTANAADTAAELLPASTLIYLEINDPLASIDSFLNHSYVADLKNMEPYKEFELDDLTGEAFSLQLQDSCMLHA